MLKKYDLLDRTWQLVVNREKSHDRTRQPVVKRDTRHELNHGPVGCRSSNTRQLGCVFQDMEPPKLTSILRKCSDMQKPIQLVKFTKAIARRTKIRDQNPSLGLICPGEPHQRSPNAPKFEDRSQEETEWQEQGAREAAWRLAKNLIKLKEHERTTFFSPSANRCLPASTLKPEKREFVVDSRATMHMVSKKDLNSAELDTLTKSCSPTIVITAYGEVQTHEEATVCVKELDFQCCRLERFSMKTDILLYGSMVKNHISLKTGFQNNATRRTSFLSWFQACQRVRPPVLISQLQGHLQDRRVIVPHLLQARLRHRQQHQVTMRLEKERIELKMTPLQCLCQ